MRTSRTLLALAVALLLGGCQATAGPEVIPAARSTIVGSFVDQNDGLAGYSMLRPANWTSTSGGPSGRIYLAPGASPAQGLQLTVTNVKVLGTSVASNGASAEWSLFQQSPTLDGWTTGIVQLWTRDGWTITLQRTQTQSKIYSLSKPGDTSMLILLADAVDQGDPLMVVVQATGTDANLARLESDGVLDDVATMAASIRALAVDPIDVEPPLPTSH